MKRKQTHTIHQYQLPIVVESCEEGGYFASCPQWLSCYAEGETVSEATKEILAVAESLVELYQEEGLRIPLKKILSAPERVEFTIPITPFPLAT